MIESCNHAVGKDVTLCDTCKKANRMEMAIAHLEVLQWHLKRCPRVCNDIYLSRDAISYGKYSKELLKNLTEFLDEET